MSRTSLTVYIDVTAFLKTESMSGIPRVVREVTVRLLRMPELRIVLFRWRANESKLSVLDCGDFLALYDSGTVKRRRIRTRGKMRLSDIESGSVLFDLDSVWSASCHSRSMVLPQLSRQGVFIVSYIYDVIAILHPEFWRSPHLNFYSYIAATLRHVDLVITSVSETVRRLSMLSERYGIPAPRCAVSWLGPDFKSTDGSISDEARRVVGLGKYLLCVCTVEPRKNHAVVLDAYDKSLSKLGINLVFAGRRGWEVEELLERIDSHPKKNKGFYFLEGENDATIDYLYDNAWAVVFPTLDEGFGLPLVEALQRGKVCVASDIPVLREVGGMACDYFDPKSWASLSEVVSGYISDPVRYEDCRRRALAYRPLSWDKVAGRIKNFLIDLPTIDITKKKLAEPFLNRIIAEIITKGYQPSINSKVDMYPSVDGSKIKRLGKKLVQKLVRPAFFGTMKKQEDFNMNTITMFNVFTKKIHELEYRIKKLERK